MPSEIYSVNVNAPIQSVWNFVSVMDQWAPLVPGYIAHEILSDKESTWKFKSDIGIMKKKVYLKVDITNWSEPTKVTFNLTGINEKFTGHGFFEAEAITDKITRMTGSLTIEAQGAMSKMVNSILQNTVPEMTRQLTEAVASRIEELQSTPTS
ncbi:CoxG family protein [Bacillus suaedaesalsae]|uniref:SRPBCC family protein n=1 Tax=Bacillus suaedaesalsae TaxID=2810349 RepID=A0ABS2DM17_9BACI|nr:SRPBCC family protein [Bacillus suaedaesalsae]MBM6619537.1 SRPBCC family protein [Bacillus suaedaesalsae]